MKYTPHITTENSDAPILLKVYTFALHDRSDNHSLLNFTPYYDERLDKDLEYDITDPNDIDVDLIV